MSTCETPIDFFSKGKRDAMAEVRTQQARGEWTQERRARWTKQAISEHLHLKHQYPEQRQAISYYAGRVCALKSKRTAPFSEPGQTPNLIARPLSCDAAFSCDLCWDKATWEIICQHTDTVPLTTLCDCCKQERVRMETAYTTPDGWDWDDDEIELLPEPVLGGGKLVVKEGLEPVSIFFPCTAIVGFGVLDLTLHIPILMVVLQAWLVLHFVREFPKFFESER